MTRRHLKLWALGVLLPLFLLGASSAGAQGKLAVGDKAPEFPHPLPSTAGEQPGEVLLSLSDVLGKKNIVLAFYVADWTGG